MKINISKLFPFFSIRSKLIVAFSLLSFIPLIIIGGLAIYSNLNTMRLNALNNLQHDMNLVKERARNYLTNINLDIRFLSHSPVVKEYLNSLALDSNTKNRDKNPR